MEADHSVKLKEEAKRIKAEQERAHHKFQDLMKHRKKEVILRWQKKRKSFVKLDEMCNYIDIYKSV